MNDINKLPLGVKLGYGIGALSYGIPVQVVTACFVFYATAVLGISGALTGLIVLLSLFLDAVVDASMGYISDKTSNSIFLGRRHFFIFFGAICLALTNYFLWSINPGINDTTKAVMLFSLFFVLKIFTSVITTPYYALGSELTTDYNERNSVQSFRAAFFFLGFLFPTIVGMTVFFRPTEKYSIGQLNPGAYSSLSIAASAIVLVCAAVCIISTYRKNSTAVIVKRQKSSLINLFKENAEALKCGDFRNIAVAYMFINVALGIMGSIGIHVFTFTFRFNNYKIAVVFGSLFLMALVSQPFWVMFAKKFEKRTAFKTCLIMDIIVSVIFGVFVVKSDWVVNNYLIILPAAMAIGFSMGGSISLPFSMISDTIDKDAYYSGLRKEGVFYGCATFLDKVAQGIAAMLISSYLDIIGFDASKTQPPEVHFNLGLALPVGFLLSFIIAFIFTSKYTLDRKAVAGYQQKLNGETSIEPPASSQDSPPDYLCR